MLAGKALRPAGCGKAFRRTIVVSTPKEPTLRQHRRDLQYASGLRRPVATNKQQWPSIQAVRPRLYRSFLTTLPTVLVPPVVFIGLLLALWTYKVFMTVVFQEKILYMSYMPPQTRSERIEDYAATCKPVEWQQVKIKSIDGTNIAIGVGTIPPVANPTGKIVICYFQGNGGSVPPRLPLLSNTLKLVQSRVGETVHCTMVALSYRGYWTSSGRPTEAGIKLDAQATLQWIQEIHPGASIVLWGQSLGAGVACAAAAEHLAREGGQSLKGLVLETPFTSVSSMLKALYPERWLPYRYLTGFLRSHWDSTVALRRIAEVKPEVCPELLLIAATRDEVVPAEEVEKLQSACEEYSLAAKRVNVIGALHNEATTRREGQEAVARFTVDTYSKEKAPQQ